MPYFNERTRAILQRSDEMRTKNASLRKGQSLWNAAVEMYPKETEPLRATDVDPFYDDKKISLFLCAVDLKLNG